MNLRDLLATQSVPNIEFSGISEMSRDVQAGDLFLALGDSVGQKTHITEAKRRGAICVLTDKSIPFGSDLSEVPVISMVDLATRRGMLASRFYSNPSGDLECVGITGTNGKTSIAYWIADLSSRIGVKTGYSGTLGWGTLGKLQPAHLTTPNVVDIQKRLFHLLKEGCSRTAIEVSSHSLDQGRVSDVHFDIGVFSNLTRDHLDYHKSMKAYAECKAKLFKDFDLKKAVVCVDDPFGKSIADYLGNRVLTYGLKGDVSWVATPSPYGYTVSWNTPWGDFENEFPFFCDFSISNLGAVIGVILSAGGSVKHLARELNYLKQIPGRMETISDMNQSGPCVIVDFAHTPEAVRLVLMSIRARVSGRLICVIGCGGDRDKGKREEMGKIVSELSDFVWLTSDNPRSEDPMKIIRQVASGITTGNYSVSLDRKDAIREAITSSQGQDIVMLLGKGDESTQEVNGVFLPFSDRDIAKEVVEGLI